MDPKFPGEDSKHRVNTRTFGPGAEEVAHFHKNRCEVWVILSGEIRVSLEGTEFVREAGQCVTIPRHSRHGLKNDRPFACELLEIWIFPREGEEGLEEDHYICEAEIKK
ncbi:cupin domain-containing protein [bacterium]|nr:cupin domain-containing protein [bacterium]